MSSVQGSFVCIALGRLNRAVGVCCWIVGLALVTQLLIWATATFMDVRFEVIQEKAPTALIVPAGDTGKPEALAAARSRGDDTTNVPRMANPIDSNRAQTKYDHIMAKTAGLALCAGTLATAIMVPLLALGVLLGVSTATPGVEQTVSAFIWSIIVGLLILPMGESLGLPWREGALMSYGYMTQHIDQQLAGDPVRLGYFQFYSHFAIMPMAAIVGVAIVGLRFSFGVGAGLGREDHRLDPVLEKEAANIKPSSLHGGRTSAAMKALNAANVAASEKKSVAATAASASQTMQVAEGEMPRRLI